ncbi:hypothetical protein VTK73DRAFT_2526 [Phialemonium thermophilum]|uniref:Uncharacterized protein n=1 Tax=Phialemonium thermophilum TaxID=223376 RepID=A0ABR3VS23_9PEZI
MGARPADRTVISHPVFGQGLGAVTPRTDELSTRLASSHASTQWRTQVVLQVTVLGLAQKRKTHRSCETTDCATGAGRYCRVGEVHSAFLRGPGQRQYPWQAIDLPGSKTGGEMGGVPRHLACPHVPTNRIGPRPRLVYTRHDRTLVALVAPCSLDLAPAM